MDTTRRVRPGDEVGLGASWAATAKTIVAALLASLIAALSPPRAEATCFCMMRMPPPQATNGQRTGLTDDPSYNPASAVFITRDGTRTVLTIEAAYQGPSVELQLVIPVPQPVSREQVRTVSGTRFRRLDRRTAPEVVHVWPPCRRLSSPARAMNAEGAGMGASAAPASEAQRVMDEFGVDIEDEWAVDEYDITLLGAAQSTGLLGYLRERGLELPDTADDVLRGYIESNHRFVIARADPTRANRLGDQMMLSPIQLEYDSEDLRVPVRLGTLNSPGEQEILLYILSPEGRFDVANRPQVTAPTDLRMRSNARGGLAELYESITGEVFRRTPGAAITEYAYPLGRRVGRGHVRELGLPERDDGRRWTLTRIRHRYGKDLAEDLTLAPAEPLRLTRRWRYPELRAGGRATDNAFHVRFVVEHTGNGCIDDTTRRRYARRWATAESMWEAEGNVWPGQALLDDVTTLGITAGSSAPAGWPPPPPPPAPVAPRAPEGPMQPMQPEAATPPVAAPLVTPAAQVPARDEDDGGLCAIAPRGSPVSLLLVALPLAGLAWRRRRRAA